MSNSNASATEVKQLRDEVQLLRDELAIMKRKYEDIIYNLDTDNFSGRFVKEQGDMRAAIEFNAEGIKTKVSNEEFKSEMEQTAEAIKTKVSQEDAETLKESILKQTADDIKLAVESLDVDVDLSNYSTIEMTSDAITSVVSKGANLKNAEVWSDTLDNLQTRTHEENSTVDKTKIYVIQTKNTAKTKVISETYYYYNTLTEKWEVLSGDSIYTMFTQTENGFEFKGNVVINGGSITWSEGDNPLLVRYSRNGTAWHKTFLSDDLYMKTSLDGGVTWSGAMRIVGEPGKDAEVTFQAVNSALNNLFKTKNGNSTTTMTNAYIYTPKIASGDFYGCNFYAGTGNGYAHMNEDGLDVYDADENLKLAMGTYKSRYRKSSTGPWVGDSILYPYLALGAGTKKYDGDDVKENIADDAGCVCKLQNGIWIGDTSFIAANRGGEYPGGVSAKVDVIDNYGASVYCGVDCNGIFIDFTDGKVYNYQDGFPYLISV